MEKSIKENITIIDSMKQHRVFLKYIDFIRFPFYRNMEIDSQINFDFPLTVIVGQNGCGKSSVLHAIYGMPQRYTPYRFWFDTKVDPIEYYNDERKRHSFWYQYTEDENVRQVVKARIKRGDDPNYWETSRPLAWAGMNSSERNSPIDKNVVYLDFRSELSAFDKYFYFGNTTKTKARNKQEFIRRKSTFLQKALTNENYIAHSIGRNLNKPVELLTNEELNAISYILGRNYNEARSIFHSFFRNEGYSVLFKTDHANYSEAFAGSGEMAVVRLVREILNASEFSLIILDEPEVSLHPGAQERLTNFLLEEIKRKKHQIIITSHSPSIIRNLPKEAIKVLYQNPNSGRFSIKENLIPEEAFFHIEFNTESKKNVYFEDCLAKEIFDAVLIDLGPEKSNLFSLIYNPGGCTAICKDFITVFCREESSSNYIVFDGDQKKDIDIDWKNYPANTITIDTLKNTIKELTNVEIHFSVDGGKSGGNKDQKLDLYKKYLDYYSKNVLFLPLVIPEEIIWNVDTAKTFLIGIYGDKAEEKVSELLYLENLKDRFSLLAMMVYNTNTSDIIFTLQKIFINAWIQKKDESYKIIKNMVSSISS